MKRHLSTLSVEAGAVSTQLGATETQLRHNRAWYQTKRSHYAKGLVDMGLKACAPMLKCPCSGAFSSDMCKRTATNAQHCWESSMGNRKRPTRQPVLPPQRSAARLQSTPSARYQPDEPCLLHSRATGACVNRCAGTHAIRTSSSCLNLSF